ncbi:MAG TPA: sugar phosphate nucleotidyltransferase [Streptosporangiaceae bacterium]|nr:sugar phosphate nucleotidyltransferase [Streptosporangiaceae bacterium]
MVNTHDVRAALLCGGRGERMGRLTDAVCKPMVPYAGACRLVDFSVANVVRSGISEMVVMSQHLENDLIDHLLRRWDGRAGLHVHLGPYEALSQNSDRSGGLPPDLTLPARPAERGTADALATNAEWLFAGDCRDLLILHADHVYSFDYTPMLRAHRDTAADVTIGVQRIERRFVKLFGMVDVDQDQRVRRLVEKPAEPTSDLIFTAFCLFRADVLQKVLDVLSRRGDDGWRHDISRDVLPYMIAEGFRVQAFPVSGYWADIGTVERYLLGHLDLIRSPADLPLADIPLTLPGARPRLVTQEGVITSAPLPDRAHVRESVLCPGSTLEPGARVERSIVLPGARVGAGVELLDTVALAGEHVTQPRSGLATLG